MCKNIKLKNLLITLKYMSNKKFCFILIFFKIFYIDSYASEATININIVYACDNNYVMPTIVSMETAINSMENTSFYEFTILHTPDVTEENKNRFNIFKETYKTKCNVNLKNMGEQYNNCPTYIWSKAAYYRLDIPFILNDKSKAIYIDGDTIISQDLQEMWKINLEDNLCAGVIDMACNKRYKELKKFNGNMDSYINSGLLLINCEAWRKVTNIRETINNYCKKIEDNNFTYIDQDIINVVCGGRIQKLPLNFMYYCTDYTKAEESHHYYLDEYYNENEFKECHEHPVIIHYLGKQKPWNTDTTSIKLYDKWRKVFYSIKGKYKFEDLKIKYSEYLKFYSAEQIAEEHQKHRCNRCC